MILKDLDGDNFICALLPTFDHLSEGTTAEKLQDFILVGHGVEHFMLYQLIIPIGAAPRPCIRHLRYALFIHIIHNRLSLDIKTICVNFIFQSCIYLQSCSWIYFVVVWIVEKKRKIECNLRLPCGWGLAPGAALTLLWAVVMVVLLPSLICSPPSAFPPSDDQALRYNRHR